ncbi:MAG: family lipolytic protein [Schumannella sp.]|nr:family lipolytic protein [Schumannella sp.]
MRWALASVVAVALLAGCAPVAAGSEGASPNEGFGIEPDTQPAITVPGGPLVAFYGDSYTLGTGASAKDKRWSTIICSARGWNEFNPSVNGLGFVNNRTASVDEPAQIIAQNPGIVFVTMGLNDNFSYSFARDDIQAAIEADFSRLKSGLPGARFIVVEPFWYTDVRPDSLQTIIGWVHDAADEIGADWIPDASHWIEHHPEWMASDGLHPNDDGYAEMARRMDAALTVLGL